MSYTIKRDGEHVADVDNYGEMLATMHRLQGQSIAWAVKYEGWQIIDNATGESLEA